MSCDRFIERLDDLLEGRVEDDERRALTVHRKSCEACGSLWALAITEPGAASTDVPAGLAESVMARTSGSPCDAARDRLTALLDGDLAAVDAALVRLHLDGCDGCRGLAHALAALAVDLRGLAAPRAPADLVAAVLARTSGRRSRTERLVALGQGLAARPRIAWEAAYLATVTLLLLVGVPDDLMASTRKALDVFRPGAVTELDRPAGQIADGAREAWSWTSREVGEPAASLARNVSELFTATAGQVGTALGTLLPDDTSGEDEDRQEPADSDTTTQGEK